jgi:F420 biosynthesis protein FbiB-like protein
MKTPKLSEEELLNLIKSRRSVRKYTGKGLTPAEIDRILDCAMYAPSAHNAQPWRFYCVNDEGKKGSLIKEMAERFREDLEKDKVPKSKIDQKIQRSIRLFSQASAVIIACIAMAGMDKYPDPSRQQAEVIMATQSLAAAIQNLLLAAKALGLGACWYCAPLFCPATVKGILELPRDYTPQALITLGHAAEDPPVPQRFRIDEVRFWL